MKGCGIKIKSKEVKSSSDFAQINLKDPIQWPSLTRRTKQKSKDGPSSVALPLKEAKSNDEAP